MVMDEEIIYVTISQLLLGRDQLALLSYGGHQPLCYAKGETTFTLNFEFELTCASIHTIRSSYKMARTRHGTENYSPYLSPNRTISNLTRPKWILTVKITLNSSRNMAKTRAAIITFRLARYPFNSIIQSDFYIICETSSFIWI